MTLSIWKSFPCLTPRAIPWIDAAFPHAKENTSSLKRTQKGPTRTNAALGLSYGSRTGVKNPPVQLGAEKKSLSQKTWSHMDDVAPPGIKSCRNCTNANRTQFESLERGFAKHRVWLIIISMPSFEGYHRSEALIGLGQTTRSTGGYDLSAERRYRIPISTRGHEGKVFAKGMEPHRRCDSAGNSEI